MIKISHLALFSTLGLGSLGAQSFNLDVQGSTGTVPPSMFGAFPGQVGQVDWEPIFLTGAATSMADINGAPTSATYRFLAPSSLSIQELTSADYGTPPGQDVRDLFDDFVISNEDDGNVAIEFDGLQPGLYRFYVYAWTPNGRSPLRFSVGSTVRMATVVHGSPFPTPPDFVNLQTFGARTLNVGAGQRVTISTTCIGDAGGSTGGSTGGNGRRFFADEGQAPNCDCTIAGIQIVPVAGVQGCAQDLSLIHI